MLDPFRTALGAFLTACVLVCAGHGAAQAQAQAQAQEPTAPQGMAPDHRQVQMAVDKVKADPDLGGVRQEKTLRLKDLDPSAKKKKDKRKPEPDAPAWLLGLIGWLADAGRLVIWTVGIIAVALLAVGMRHWIRVRAEAPSDKALPKLPSHVRELDIRPDSLPERIGATARAMWERGEHHAALSLLYRGALSRLVHDHGVPIRAASTEGECVQLASRRLGRGHAAFFGRIVAAWQLTIYGARLPEPEAVLALCDAFEGELGPRGPVATSGVRA